MTIEVYGTSRAVLIMEVSLVWWTDKRKLHINHFNVSGPRPVSLWNRELKRLEREAIRKRTCLDDLYYFYDREELELRLDDSQPTREQREKVIKAVERVLSDITGQHCFIRRQR